MTIGNIVRLYGPEASAIAKGLPEEQRKDFNNQRMMKLAEILIITAIILILVALVGRYLWNHALVPNVTFAKPMDSIWPILGIAILISILHPGNQ